MGNLYIVATPIGNLQDITKRAIDTLNNVDFILCEDTRKTQFLLQKITAQKFPIQKLVSYYEENEASRIPGVIKILKDGFNVAIVSDAGTPLISDPGFKLVRACMREGIKVVSVPGPCSVISAIVSSGLPTDKFLFLGFLPKKQGHRMTLLKNLKKALELISSTVILFEAPHRITKTLGEVLETFGDIELVMARELSKIHEEIAMHNVSEFQTKYKNKNPKGEIILLFNIKEQS